MNGGMKLRIKTRAESDIYLRQMAAEAQVSVEDLVEVAVYNLVALWVASREAGNALAAASFVAGDSHDDPDVARLTGNVRDHEVS